MLAVPEIASPDQITKNTANTREPLLEVIGLQKHFGGVQALKGVDLKVRAGEVHGLVGANGAGKSTLIRILAGVTLPDAGTILLDKRSKSLAAACGLLQHFERLCQSSPGCCSDGCILLAYQLHRASRSIGATS